MVWAKRVFPHSDSTRSSDNGKLRGYMRGIATDAMHRWQGQANSLLVLASRLSEHAQILDLDQLDVFDKRVIDEDAATYQRRQYIARVCARAANIRFSSEVATYLVNAAGLALYAISPDSSVSRWAHVADCPNGEHSGWDGATPEILDSPRDSLQPSYVANGPTCCRCLIYREYLSTGDDGG